LIARLVDFCERLGFRDTFRTPNEGQPIHVEVTLDGFTVGIASVDAAAEDHGLHPELGGPARRDRALDGRHRRRVCASDC
jgi:hypothetical protein